MKSIVFTILVLLSATSNVAWSQGSVSGDSLTLNAAVQMAIHESPMILQGQAAVEAAQARTQEISAITRPQLSATGSYTRIDPTVKVQFGDQSFQLSPNDNYNVGLTLEQNIWDFGHAQAQLNVAKSSEQSVADNLDQYRSLAAYQTVQVFYALLATDESLNIEQTQLKVLKENLGITQEREKAGTATPLDPLTTQVRISSIESQIAELGASKLKQESMLRRLTGIEPGHDILLSKNTPVTPLSSSLASLESSAQLARAEIKVAKDAEATAKLQIEAARLSDNPAIGASVSAGIKDGYLPDLYKPIPNWSGTIGLRVPILDGGKTKYAVEEAEANYRAAQAHTLDVERTVTNEIEQAYADVTASKSRLSLATIQIAQAQQAYDIALLRYRNGAATNLDLITAQSALEQANLQQAQLSFSYELNQYNLNRAIGTTMW